MNADRLRELQAPLKARYKESPRSAIVTLKARGRVSQQALTCTLETGKPGVPAGLHPATGGDGSAACSGDMLLEALVGCAGVTMAAVSTSMGITLTSAVVSAEGDLDFRGTLGVARDAPVGFARIRLSFSVQTDAPPETVKKLVELTERYCVVLQTLTKPPLNRSASRIDMTQKGAPLMRAPHPSSKSARGIVVGACTLGALVALAPRSADAHYVLQDPASYDAIDPGSGLPEKLGPCGNEVPQTLTNAVTAFQEGQSITITINEVVFHPGHYRVALAMTPDHMQPSFPDDPVPTPGLTNSGTMLCADGNTSPCGSIPIEDPPMFPVLADNLFEHCVPFADPVSGNPEPQSTTIKLPAGVTCNKCTLQVLEFMSDHGPNVPGGCFYHHCADISIQVVDGGAPDGSGASGVKGSSGGCSTSPLPGRDRLLGTALASIAAALGLLFRARRRARRIERAAGCPPSD